MNGHAAKRSESSHFRIRRLAQGDAPQIAPLLSDVGFPMAGEAIGSRIRLMTDADEYLFAATVGEEIAGVATLHLTPTLHRMRPVGRITLLVVSKEHRGVGIGRALVEACETATSEAGGSIVEVISNLRYAEAHDFYGRLGYELTSHKFKKVLSGMHESQDQHRH